ncbi:MAG: hypothetical protein ACREX9_23165 [Gammaproteobacteria bacterium]
MSECRSQRDYMANYMRHKRQQAANREALASVVTLDDWRAITQRAAEDAKQGDPSARAWLMEHRDCFFGERCLNRPFTGTRNND